MQYIGDVALGSTFDHKFTMTDSTGLPATLTGSPVISAYVGNSTTELTAGITLTADFDGRVGLNNVRVVGTSGNGYATASNYQLVITSGTVSGVSVVGYVIGTFSIEARSGLRPTTAGRTLVVDAAGLADATTVKVGPTGAGTAQVARDLGTSVLLSPGTGTGQLDFTTGVVKANAVQWLGTTLSTPTVAGVPNVNAKTWNDLATVALPLVPLTAGRALDVTAANKVNGVVLTDTVTTYTGNTVQTGDAYARLGAPAGASHAADVAAVKAVLPTALTSGGNIKAGVQGFLDSVFTEGAIGRVAAGFKQFFNIATPAATMDHGVLTDTITTYTGNTVQTGDSFARLGSPAGASHSADVAAVKVDTAAIKLKTDNLPEGMKKNTAFSTFPFYMVDSADHITAKTGLTVTAQRSIDGGAFASCTNSPSEIGSGFYKLDLSAADLNGVFISLKFSASGADTRALTIKTGA